jgi:DNA-binding MarR family transcriptional regulator
MSRRVRTAKTGTGLPSTQRRTDTERLRLWLSLLRTSRQIERELRNRLKKDFNVTLPHFDVMAALARARDGLTMTELSHALLVSNGNVTGMIDTLTAEGVVVRVPSSEDRRTITVKLTVDGSRRFKELAAAHREWIDEIFAPLQSTDIAAMQRSLQILREAEQPTTLAQSM